MKTIAAGALIWLAATIAPLSGQEWEVARRTFSFQERNLTIDVIADGSGNLQIVRGEVGHIEVAARAPRGFSGFALGGRQRDELRLTAMGASQVDYLVVVPEEIRVRVRLPDRRSVEVASTRPAATYNWGREVAKSRGVDFAAMVPENGRYLSHYSRNVPRTLSIPDHGYLEQLELTFSGSTFRLETDRPVSVKDGSSTQIEFRAGQPGSKLFVTLPSDTRDFRLVLSGKLALEVTDGLVRSYCDQVVSVHTQDGRKVYSYTPSRRLVCR
jgi:hypothetical protein